MLLAAAPAAAVAVAVSVYSTRNVRVYNIIINNLYNLVYFSSFEI